MLVLAAILVVWNVAQAPIDVMIDGIVQCTVESNRACRVTGITAGTHRVGTGPVKTTYNYGGVETNPGDRITFQPNTGLKICRTLGLIPDACDRWLRDTMAEAPPGIPTQTVPYKMR